MSDTHKKKLCDKCRKFFQIVVGSKQRVCFNCRAYNKSRLAKKHRDKHPETYEHTKKRLVKHNEKKKKLLRRFKRKAFCVCCGQNHPATIEYHHVDPGKKTKLVPQMPLKKIKSEIRKCAPLCRNCHAIFHYELRNMD